MGNGQSEFKGFLTHLDSKLMYGNKNHTQLTLLKYMKLCVQNTINNKKGMMKNIAKLALYIRRKLINCRL